MSWNYRVVRRKHDLGAGETEETFSIHEAYYQDDADVPHSITEQPVEPCAETLEGLLIVLTQMLKGANKPVLHWEDF